MKKKKILKRILAGALSITMVAGIFFGETMNNTKDVQADTRVFTGITDKFTPAGVANEHVIKILEISTTAETYSASYTQNGGNEANTKRKINKNAELGYFIPFSSKDPNIADYDGTNDNSTPMYLGLTNQGGKYGDPAAGTGEEVNEVWWPEYRKDVVANHGGDAEYEAVALRFRDYGLVKPFGADNGWQTYVGEYPIYTKGATFASSKSDVSSGKIVSGSLVPGVYSYSYKPDGSVGGGNYKIADGYAIDPETAKISTVSENTVSDNGIPVGTKIYTAVTDISTTSADLPKSSATGEYYITRVDDGAGDLNFTETEAEATAAGLQQYYGYSRLSLWYASPGADFSRAKNSGWFAEYVLGSYKKYRDTNITYDVKHASTVTVDDVANYDLIYLSGTHAEISANPANDIKQNVMKALYESTLNEHKAIIMDFDGYAKGAVLGDDMTNFSRLAALLWQDSQDDLFTDSQDNTNPAYGLLSKDEATKKVTLNLNQFNGREDDLKKAFKALRDRCLAENESFVARTDGNFVIGNVYVYDHHMKDFVETKSRVDAEDSLATGDFISPYNATVVSAGFNNVLKYIQATNKNSLTGNMANEVTPAVVIQYILVSDGLPLTVMKNSLNVLEIQAAPAYLYNPTRGSTDYADLPDDLKTNRDNFIKDFLSSYYDTNEMRKRITFTSYTVAEFNGLNDDLIETYDIIYIGDETTRHYGALKNSDLYTMSSASTKPWNEATKTYGTAASGLAVNANIPTYHDSNMNGMIYYNIGDFHSSVGTGCLSGHIKKEDTVINNGVTLRWPGRDITKDKLNKLTAFLKAGALVITAEEIYGDNKVNPTAVGNSDHGRVDNSSNLYEFLMLGNGKAWSEATGTYVNTYEGHSIEPYPNLVSAADVKKGTVDKADLNQYIAAQKLDLLISQKPAEYGYSTFTTTNMTTVIDPSTVTYAKDKNSAGKRILKYVFSIGEDNTLVDEIDTALEAQYICRLYMDINNDGKYSKTTEDISDVLIVDSAGAEPARNTENGDDHYLLVPGVEYTLTRELADSYCGIVKWKLVVESKIKSTVHASEEGYTMIKNETGKKKTVKILQITAEGANSHLNLMKSLYDERNAMKNAAPGAAIAHNKWGKYLYDVPDYNLEIRTMSISQFQTDFNNSLTAYNDAASAGNKLSASEYAKQYFDAFEVKSPNVTSDPNGNSYNFTAEEKVIGVNMIVLGFGDNFPTFGDPEPVAAIKSFIEQGNPVLLTHDFIMYQADNLQVKLMRQAVGMDKYGSSQRLVAGTATGEVTNTTLTHYFENRFTDANTENTNGYDYLFAGVNCTRSSDPAKVSAIEGTNKEVVYSPGTERGTVSKYTQGLSFDVMERFTQTGTGAYNQTWFKKSGAPGAFLVDTNGFSSRPSTIEKINDGQITHYPYILPEDFGVNDTHSQYFELDLTSDNDFDGESDVVVWYAFKTTGLTDNGHNRYDDERGISVDPANGYYIYNKGNLTYTGAGHSSLTNASDSEIQLFVNTLLATFDTGNVEPAINFYDKTDVTAAPITSIVVPYDEVITKPAPGSGGVDSSVLKKSNGDYKYKFVDPNANASINKSADGTVAYFRIDDKNLVRGSKSIAIRYFLQTEAPEGTDVATNRPGVTRVSQKVDVGEDQSVNLIDITDLIETYKVTNNVIHAEAMTRDGLDENNKPIIKSIESSKPYAIFLPMDYLNDKASFTIYLEAQTTVKSVTSSQIETTTTTKKVYKPLTVVKADLLDLD